MEYPLELIVPRINYLDINELFQQQNVIFGRLLSALNIDRRHFSGSHAIARLKLSRRVNSNTPSNFILPGLILDGCTEKVHMFTKSWKQEYCVNMNESIVLNSRQTEVL